MGEIQTSLKTLKMKDQNAPKRPLSGYMRFIGTIRAEVEAESGLNGIKVTPLLSARWNALSEEEKAPFNNKAGKEMEKYKKKMAAYKKTRKYKEFQLLKKAKKLQRNQKIKINQNAQCPHSCSSA